MSSGAGMSSLRKGLLSLVGLRQRDRSEFFPLDGPSGVHADLSCGKVSSILVLPRRATYYGPGERAARGLLRPLAISP